jgi:hypothetical protein
MSTAKQITVTKRKLISAFIGIALICIISTGSLVYVAAQSGTLSTITISGGQYPGAPTYTIFAESGTTYAKNANGVISYSSTSGTTVLQLVIDAIRGTTNPKIIFNGDLTITDRINMTGITNGMTWEQQNGKIIINQNSNVVFDCTGSAAFCFKNMYFLVTASYTPSNIFLLARTSSGQSAGNHVFQNCIFNSYTSNADKWIYDYGSEIIDFQTCAFYANNTFIMLTTSNFDSVTSPFVTIATGPQSTSQISFCAETTFSPNNDVIPPIELEGVQSVYLTNVWAGTAARSNYLLWFRYAATPVHCDQIVIRDSFIEQRLIVSDTPGGAISIENLKLDSVRNQPDVGSTTVSLNNTDLYVVGHTISNLQIYLISGVKLEYKDLVASQLILFNGDPTYEPSVLVNTATATNIAMYNSDHATVNNLAANSTVTGFYP